MNDNSGNPKNESCSNNSNRTFNVEAVDEQDHDENSDLLLVGNDFAMQNVSITNSESARNHPQNVLSAKEVKTDGGLHLFPKQGAPANFPSNQLLVKRIHPKTDSHKLRTKEITRNPLGWQAEKETVKDRLEFLFCNEVLADVFFYVGFGSEKQKIPAHTFVLSIGSAVFDAMFKSHADTKQNGLLHKHSNHIFLAAFEVHISDVEVSIFISLLRFLYTDEVDVEPESVMSTLYIAKKYGVPAMENICLSFLKENLETDNAFLLLSQARLFDENDLEKMCLDVIDRETYETIHNDGFLEIDHATLCGFLRRDTLRIKEAVLFKAVIRWADAECKRKFLESNAESHKLVLGEALQLIRFPLMTVEEFANVAAQTGLLEDRDIVTQFLHYHTDPKTPTRFIDRPRSAASGREHRVVRFTKSEARWGYSGHADKIKFSVDKAVFILGFGVYGSINTSHEYSVTLELIHSEKGHSVAQNETSYTSDGTPKVFPVYFRAPVHIQADTFYTASVTVQGPDTYYGTKGQRKVVYRLNDKMTDITFIFSLSGNNNGTCVDDGQIPEILFSTQMT